MALTMPAPPKPMTTIRASQATAPSRRRTADLTAPKVIEPKRRVGRGSSGWLRGSSGWLIGSSGWLTGRLNLVAPAEPEVAEGTLHRARLEAEPGRDQVQRTDVVEAELAELVGGHRERQVDELRSAGHQADERQRHRHDRPALAERAQDLRGDLPVGPVARPTELERRPDRGRILERASDDRRHVTHEDRLEPALPIARHRHDPRGEPDEAGDDIEEAVARAELERRLEDRPVQAGGADRGLRPGLRARVVEARIVDDAQGAHVDQAPDAGRRHGRQERPRSLGVDPGQVGAVVAVARERHQVDDRVDAGHRRRQGARSSDVAVAHLEVRSVGRGEAGQDGLGGRLAADQGDDSMAGGEQRRNGVAADEPAGAGHEDRGHAGRVASRP